jgi:hypothetical protein
MSRQTIEENVCELDRSRRGAPRLIAMGVLAAMSSLVFVTPARAQDKYFEWKNAAPLSGNWSNAAKWNAPMGETVPNANNALANFNLQNVAAYTATLDMNSTVKEFYLGSAMATVAIPADKTLTTTTRGRIMRSGGTMDLRGTYIGPLENAATINVGPGGGTSVAAVIDSTAFEQKGALNITADSQGVGRNSSLTIRGSFESSGTITITDAAGGDASLILPRRQVAPGNLGDYYTLTNKATGRINMQGSHGLTDNPLRYEGNLTNQGTMSLSGGYFNFYSIPIAARPGQPARIGGVYRNDGGTMDLLGANTILRLDGDSFTNTKDHLGRKGVVEGNGTVDVTNLTIRKFVNDDAKVKPRVVGAQQQALLQLGRGLPTPDQLNIVGDYDQINGAALVAELDASAEPIHFGQLNVNGVAYLTPDATIELSLLSDAYLQPGQEFPVLVAQTLSGGACPEISIPGLDGHWPSVYYSGHYFSVNCDTPNTVTLQVDSVPEPATLWPLLLLAVSGWNGRRGSPRGTMARKGGRYNWLPEARLSVSREPECRHSSARCKIAGPPRHPRGRCRFASCRRTGREG